MKFEWEFLKKEPQKIKYFIKDFGVSRNLFAKIKFQGGQILVNDVEQNAVHLLKQGDHVTLVMPQEFAHESVKVSNEPLDIVFEDEHLLVVNKPSGVASLPSQVHPDQTMANRVRGYYQRQNYADQVIHIVTRLDRDTSGLMLFAKHSYAHALMDQQLHQKKLQKTYLALVEGQVASEHSEIKAPIARVTDSIMIRQVAEGGKEAWTEYWVERYLPNATLVKIRLHTGRTHQIRVHFQYLGHVLVGDDLYGGKWTDELKRQALHCAQLDFIHPMTHATISLKQALPSDMQAYLDNN